MDREEAERIAQAIRSFGEPFVVIGVEFNRVSGHHEVRCEYHGKTKQWRNVYLEGNITLLVESPRAWITLQHVAMNGREVQ
jgi:hypothetical protein